MSQAREQQVCALLPSLGKNERNSRKYKQSSSSLYSMPLQNIKVLRKIDIRIKLWFPLIVGVLHQTSLSSADGDIF